MNILFLDDERFITDVFWITYPDYVNVYIVRTYNDFVGFVSSNDMSNYLISFDHDLQDFNNGREYTGYDCAKWLCEFLQEKIIDIKYVVHSQNIIGKTNINTYINNYVEHGI